LSQALDGLNYILKKVREEGVRTVFVLRDFDPYLDSPVIVRRLRVLVFALKRSYSTLILLSPLLVVPPHLDKDVDVLDYDCPGLDELHDILEELVRRVSGDPGAQVD